MVLVGGEKVTCKFVWFVSDPSTQSGFNAFGGEGVITLAALVNLTFLKISGVQAERIIATAINVGIAGKPKFFRYATSLNTDFNGASFV